MRLSTVLGKATTISELNDIFDGNVKVKLGSFGDLVSVKGYKGTVSSDAIASKIESLIMVDSLESKHLASSLAEKVFKPLKNLVESPENYCSLYQIVALKRIGYPPPSREFGTCVALRHAVILGFLDEARYSTG